MERMRFSETAEAQVERDGKIVDVSLTSARRKRKQRILKSPGIPIGRNDPCPCRCGKKNKHHKNVRFWWRDENDNLCGRM